MILLIEIKYLRKNLNIIICYYLKISEFIRSVLIVIVNILFDWTMIVIVKCIWICRWIYRMYDCVFIYVYCKYGLKWLMFWVLNDKYFFYIGFGRVCLVFEVYVG